MIGNVKTPWTRISLIWLATGLSALWAVFYLDQESAFAWFGAELAGSMALVSIFHLIKASPQGFVRELIYVAGGSYLILALTSIYLLLAR